MCTNVQGLSYWEPQKGKHGELYSVDKIVVDYKLRGAAACQAWLDDISNDLLLQYDHWETRKIGTYRNQFSFKAEQGGGSWWAGVGLNNGKLPAPVVRLEYNPNKVWMEPRLRAMAQQLRAAANHVHIKQFDLAVDMPGQRRDFALQKDGRLYEELRKSAEDLTQYLGARNQPGRCKLYNKQIESKLPAPVVRLELTCPGGATAADIAGIWPRVVQDVDAQTNMKLAQLNDTDRFIYLTLLQQPERLTELSRRKREKMEQLLQGEGRYLEMDRAAVAGCLRVVENLVGGGEVA